MRAVNLLPQDAVRNTRRVPNPPVLVGGVGGALVVVALLLAMVLARGDVADRRAELEAAKAVLAVTPRPAAPSEAESKLAAQRTPRIAALSAALQSRVAWDRVLRRVALVLPHDVWLTTLSAKTPAAAGVVTAPPPTSSSSSSSSSTSSSNSSVPAPEAVPTGFMLSGYTYSHEGVARLLARLAVVPELANVQLQTSTLAKVGTREIVQFTVVADVRGGNS